MERVWRVVYWPRKGSTADAKAFLRPAKVWPPTIAADLRARAKRLRDTGGANAVPQAKALEAEARVTARLKWKSTEACEQDEGARLFFYHIFHAGLEPEVELLDQRLSDIKEWRDLAAQLRGYARLLNSRCATVARQLSDLADDCDEHADGKAISPGDDPWLIARKRGSAVERALVAEIWMICRTIFQKDLSTTVGTIASVILRRPRSISREQVRSIIRWTAKRELA